MIVKIKGNVIELVTTPPGSHQIRNVHVGDEGTYQCRAENTEDSIDAAAVLDVAVAPEFVKKPENTLAFEKEDVTMECSVYGRPQVTVQWYKNGDLIVESEYFQVHTQLLQNKGKGEIREMQNCLNFGSICYRLSKAAV